MQTSPSVGEHLRQWRQRRRMSQLDLALEAEISTRHLSFLETGRARPSREMVLQLSQTLEIPLRERNLLLLAAGFAPSFPERPLDSEALGPARRAMELVLKGHEPYPALALDRRWNMVLTNGAVAPLLEGVDPGLLAKPVNVLRMSLHPQGLAPRIANLAEWRRHLLERLKRQIELTADAGLMQLMDELKAYPSPPGADRHATDDLGGLAVPLELLTPSGTLRFFSTTTVFGTAVDVTLSELILEAFYPADGATAEALRALSPSRP